MCKKRNKLLFLGFILSALLISGCGKKSLYTETDSSETPITSVEGVSFDIPTSFFNIATPISEIADSIDYRNGTYVWQTDSSKYLFFNINQIVITVDNNTTFDMKNAKDKEQALASQDINNSWLKKCGDKFTYQTDTTNDAYKIMATVASETTIINSLYGDFVGKFVSIQKNDHECSMFIGVPGSSYDEVPDNQKEVIEQIAKSLQYRGNIAASTDSPDNTDSTFSTETINDASTAQNDSSQYLKLLDSGMYLGTDSSGNLQTGTITLLDVKEGKAAEKIIKKALSKKDSKFKYENAPSGYTWCLAEYQTDVDPNEIYPNIKIKDISGVNLKKKTGEQLSTRTMDILSKMEQSDNLYSKLYCFYLIPDSYSEYMIEIGLENPNDDQKNTVCYKITR